MSGEIIRTHLTWLPLGHPQITSSFGPSDANLPLDLFFCYIREKGGGKFLRKEGGERGKNGPMVL